MQSSTVSLGSKTPKDYIELYIARNFARLSDRKRTTKLYWYANT